MEVPRSRLTLGALLTALLLVIVFWNPLIRPGVVYPSSDLTCLFWPQRVHLAEAFAEGVVPLWNAHTFGGSPFLASMQPGVFDVTGWPWLLGDDPVDLLEGFNRQRLLLFLILSVNTFALCLSGLRLGLGGALLAAVTLPCCGFLWGHFDHVNQLSTLSWFPLVMLAALWSIRGESWSPHPLLAGAVALQIFAGHPQHAALGALAVGVVALTFLIANRCTPREWLRISASLGTAYLLGAMIGAVQLIPGIELSGLSERQFDTPEYAATFSMQWAHLQRLVWPGIFGVFPHYTAEGNFSELGLFVGRIPLALALIAIALGVTRRSPHTVALIAMGLFALMWALGSNGPIFTPLVTLIPPLRSFRVPPRMLFYLDLSLTMLAAVGMSKLLGRLRDQGWSMGQRGGLAVLTALLCLADLWAASRADYFRQPQPPEVALTPSPLASAIADRDPLPRIHRLQLNDADYYMDPRAPALGRRLIRLQPNLGMLWGISDISGYTEGLLPTARWMDLQGLLHSALHRRALDAQVLALLGVRWVITETSSTPIDPTLFRQVQEIAYAEGDETRIMTLWENPQALPPVIPRAVGERLADPANLDGPWTHGLVERPTTVRQPFTPVRPGVAWPTADELPVFPLQRVGPNALRLENPSGFEGDVILFQASCPGWIVRDEILGRRPLTPLNAVWSTLTLAPGVLEVTVRFEPVSCRLGLFISAVGMLLLSALAARRAGGSGPRRRDPRPCRAVGCDRDTR
ncbi:hypothetical protein JXA47_03110 [Candidatus Sumerlaeota bacterium]|nr:hypothetical protein [Candidatus Sumerlaeota bacterium]